MQQVLENFSPRHAALWGGHTVRLRHNLHRQELFSDASLAGLIETMAPQHLQITTMAREGHDLSTWRHCERGDLSGETVLEAVRSGRIWINMTGIDKVDPRFAEMLDAMYGELQAYMPEFQTFRRKLGLLISSPNAQVFYHADIPGQGLWQIRGRKRIHIYPNTEPFLMPCEIENVIRGLQEEDIHYEPWFEDYAEVHDLEPGDMLHWALNGPHRVTNHDCLNVSLTTEHWTPGVRRQYAMNYGNGILRSQFGWTPSSRATTGAAFWAKVGLTALWKKTGLQARQRYRPAPAYLIDPAAPDGVRPIAA